MIEVRDRSLFIAWGLRRIFGGSAHFHKSKRGDQTEMTSLKEGDHLKFGGIIILLLIELY